MLVSLSLLAVCSLPNLPQTGLANTNLTQLGTVPDFRSSDGLFKTLRKDHKLKASGKELFDASVYLDGSMTSSFHDMVRLLSEMATAAQPSAFHYLLAQLAKKKRLLRLYTQNIDGIDVSLPPLTTDVPLGPLGAKNDWPKTIQLHGGLNHMICQKCRHTSGFQPQLFQGPDPPLCPKCCEDEVGRVNRGQRSRGIGKLRPRIVLYNEHNPDEEAIGSVVTADLRTRPDALVVVGTSLKIPGVRRIVKEMCRVVRSRKDGVTIWINHDDPPVGREFENSWDLVVKGDCDDVAKLVGLQQFDAPILEAGRSERGHGEKVAVVLPASASMHEKEKLTETLPERLPSCDSGFRAFHQMLDGKPKKPLKVRKSTSTKKTQKQRKIDPNFRVTKPNGQGETKNAKNLVLDGQLSTAMHPISPGAARNNGPMLHSLVSMSAPWDDLATSSPPGELHVTAQKSFDN